MVKHLIGVVKYLIRYVIYCTQIPAQRVKKEQKESSLLT